MEDLNLIYKKYKQQILPIVFLLAAFFVIFKVIMPQWSEIQDFKSSLEDKSVDVKTLKSNIDFLDSISDDVVNKNYDLLTTAIPQEKNILLIFTELNNVADKNNVTLGGLSVKVGGVYSSDKNKPITSSQAIDGIPYLNISVEAKGNTISLKDFGQSLYQSLPLVDIKEIDIGENDARYDVNFFFEPLKTVSGVSTQALKSLSASDSTLLNQLNLWSSNQ
jgi:hypothetical protein